MDPFDLRQWKGFVSNTTEPAIVSSLVTDSRRVVGSDTLFVALKGEKVDGHAYVAEAAAKGARWALVEQGFTGAPAGMTLLRVPNVVTAFQEIVGAYRDGLGATVVAVTGSRGKTLVKDLLAFLVSDAMATAWSPESFNSQIGVPLSLLGVRKLHKLAILEAGVSQPGEMDPLARMLRPTHAILTNVGQAHLATLGGSDALIREKMRLLQEASGWVLMPSDDRLEPFLRSLRGPVDYWDKTDRPHAQCVYNDYSSLLVYRIDYPDGSSFEGRFTEGLGFYLEIINIAVKAAWKLGVPAAEISAKLAQHVPEPMLSEVWTLPQGTTLVNSPYCSDPLSVDKALAQLPPPAPGGKKIFVFGGMRDNPEVKHLLEAACKRHGVDRILASEKELGSLTPGDVVLFKGAHKAKLSSLMSALSDLQPATRLTINLSAVKANLELFRAKLPAETRILVMVKALGYGTDNVILAKYLNLFGVEILGVAYLDEAVSLRQAGVEQSLFVINAAPYEIVKLVRYGFEVGVSDRGFLEILAQEAARQKRSIKVHLHIDTGMSRLGCRPEEALPLARFIKSSLWLDLEGIFTHFAAADDPTEDDFTLIQAALLEKAISNLEKENIRPRWRHAANSGGAMRFDFPAFNMVRIGLAILGLHPSRATQGLIDLRLAIALTTRITGINVCKQGETISYGRTYTVPQKMARIATLPVGYFDGLHRHYSNQGHVMIRGQKAPMVGTICMDYMMVDITDVPNAAVGDTALLFGADQCGQFSAPEAFSERGHTNAHELMACLGRRIHRLFIFEE